MINVVIVDDHPIVRAGMKAILDGTGDIHVLAEGGCGEDAILLVERFMPDVLVLDIGLPDKNGLEVTSNLQNKNPKTAILILTAHDDPQMILSILENGAVGYILKDEALETLANAVRAAARGKSWLSPSIASQIIQKVVKHDQERINSACSGLSDDDLTPRELEILQLLGQGLDNTAIADRLTLTKRTVQNHISTIYSKMGVKTRAEAMLYAIQHGISRIT